MIPGFVLLALAGLMLWRGFTGQSPLAEIQRLVSGEPIFVRDQSLQIGERITGGGERTGTNGTGGDSNAPPEIAPGRPS